MNRRQVLAGAAALAACGPANGQAPAPFPIRRGVNMGNALEAAWEGEWGYQIQERHLAAIAEAGFDGVRLPVRWDEHAEGDPGYRIDADFFARVDKVIAQAVMSGLKVQLDVHHFWRLMDQPERYMPRLPELWRQIAAHYHDAPPELVFELWNEPNGGFWTARRVTAIQQQAIAAIRESNPDRLIVAGPANWNSLDGLLQWTPPEDHNLAATFHYYEPHAFTHQDADWMDDPPRFDRDWGTADDVAQVRRHIARAADWARGRGLPLQLGEFGVNRMVPLDQRALWLRTVREACDEHGIGWCAWDFAGTFPIYDLEREAFTPALREALLGR